MPFDTTTTPPATDAEVRIFFNGLLLLRPQGKNCETLIHHLSADHFLTVEVFEDHAPPNVPVVRFAGPLLDPLEITTDAPKGVTVFRPTDPNDPKHFNWALDIHRLHSTATINPAGVHRNSITLFDGVLSSALLSDRGVSLERQIDPSQCQDRDFVTVLVGAHVKLDGRQFWLTSGAAGKVFTAEAGKKYLIYISNQRGTPVPPTGSLGDLDHYYMALSNVNAQDKLQLRLRPCGPHTEDTTRVPCMSVVLDA